MMDPHALRVARRFVASLAHEFKAKMDAFLAKKPLDVHEAGQIAAWMTDNFWFLSPKTPKGQKDLKKKLSLLHWTLKSGMHSNTVPDGMRATIERDWSEIEPHLADLVKYFSEEGGKSVPKEMKIGSNTYINEVGLDDKKLAQFAARMEQVFSELKGWRTGALAGGVKVMFASPQAFGGGTAGGKYKSEQDIMMVRTTPNVLKRSAGYASFDYIIVHELGHRYERKHHVSFDFDRPEWYTSRYSSNEGETFAELFAISNYNLTGPWLQDRVDRFDTLMQHGGKLKPEIPQHIKDLRDKQPQWQT